MTPEDAKVLATLHGLTAIVERSIKEPYGPAASPELRAVAGDACVTLCGGDQDQARTLWKLVTADLGYMPHAAASALVRAANTVNLVPDAEPSMVDW